MVAAGLEFAEGDTITLNVTGTTLSTSISALGAIGVDVIDFAQDTDTSAHITLADATSMIDAGIAYASGDTITLNVAGTTLSTSMSSLAAIGVDEVYYEGTGDTVDVTDESILRSFLSAMPDMASVEGTGAGDFVLNNNSAPDGSDLIDLLSAEFGSAVTTDDVYGDLIRTLTGADVSLISLQTTNHIEVDDSLAAALVEAGILEALPATKLEIDATASANVVDTSLAAMARLGVDQVVLADQGAAPVYVDLGIEQGLPTGAELLALFSTLDADNDTTTPLFVGATHVALVVDQETADLIKATDGAMDAIGHLGFTQLAVAGADAGYDAAFGSSTVTVKLIGQNEDPFHHIAPNG
jgi:hypothetical protein